MTDSQKTPLNRFKEQAEMISIFGKWGVLFTGGLCLLIYANEIGTFPEGLQLGEGLAFYLISAGFLLVYSFYTLGLVALGSIPFRWIYPGAIRALNWYSKKRGKTQKNRSFEQLVTVDFSVMWSGEVWGGALIGLMLIGFLSPNWSALWLHLELVMCEGALLGILVASRRKRKFLDAGLAPTEAINDDTDNRKKQHTILQRLLIAAMIAMPMLLSSQHFVFAEAAFRIAQLRKDKATIQIQKQWATRLIERGQTAAPSFLGEDYREFVGINVLLRSVGTKVTIQLPAHADKKAASLSIPSENIVVE